MSFMDDKKIIKEGFIDSIIRSLITKPVLKKSSKFQGKPQFSRQNNDSFVTNKNMSVKPKKSLGQNFLLDKNIIDKIIHAAKIGSNDVVLEVGPGTGSLTKFIVSQKPKKIYLIEKDESLANDLEKKY